jgi:uncharacterized membrane-anchored protein YjiN (DUF445 family)
MDKETELQRNKNKALALLVVAFLVFLATAFMQRGFWMDGVKAVAEAAMVGALADWFAVVALFRRVPIPFVSSHTEIIPKNKDRIADNLAEFVREKFLDAKSIVGLVSKHDPANSMTMWLQSPGNANRVGDYMIRVVSGMLDVTDDARIQGLLKDALHTVFDKVDISKSVGAILDTLTKDGRHQELLDEGIAQIVALFEKEETREFIAHQVVDWIKEEYSTLEKILPTAAIGNGAAGMIRSGVNQILKKVSDDRDHMLRKEFDSAVQVLIARLKSDRSFLEKGEELKRHLRDGEMVSAYVKDLWGALRTWIKTDVSNPHSLMHAKIAAMGEWLGAELASNAELRESVNAHMIKSAESMVPELAGFLTRHISDTVKNWNTREMSHQIELNIGKDLQYIRINGTIVGGFIGMLLYLGTHLLDLARIHVA